MKVAFYKGSKTIYGRLIKWWTGGPYSHVELAVSKNANGTYLCISSSEIDGGVRMKSINVDDATKWDCIELSQYSLRRIDAWIQKNNGKGYDWMGTFGIALPAIFRQNKRRWFCSEAVADMIGMQDPSTYSPNSLYRFLSNNKSTLT